MKLPQVSESVEGEAVSPELSPLLANVYAQILREPADLAALRTSLRELLTFLGSSRGRTNANCWAADLFFLLGDRWERGWEHLPPSYQDLLGDLGGALHDTVSHPEIAENFDSTPELLLVQLDRIEDDSQAV